MNRPFTVHPYEHYLEHRYDLMIAAVGFEARAIHIAQNVKMSVDRRIALGFINRQVLNFADNKEWFTQNEFKYFEQADSEFRNTFIELLQNIIKHDGDSISLVIDISCFNRYRLATMVDVIRSTALLPANIIVDFLYVIGEFSPPPTHFPPNTQVGPVSGEFAGWTVDPSLPPAAVIGLGYEQGKALGAVDHLQISRVLAFIPVSAIPEYVSAVKEANTSLLATLGDTNVFNYQVHDPASCFYMLESVVNGLSAEFNPILLPFGPKIFTVCALLAASQHRNAAVWRVSGGESEEPSDRRASEHIVGLTVKFGNGPSQ